MKFASLNDLYLQQLKDLHSAESQLIKALPKMAKATRNPDLRNAFIEHLEQTKGHLDRLKQVAEKLGKRLAGHTCAAMKGLIEEGSEWIGEDAAAEVMDAGIIAAARRVEHYEMAGYGTLQTFAKPINVKAKAEKPPASVKTAVKKSAKLPVEIPSAGQREVQGIESNMEAKESQSE